MSNNLSPENTTKSKRAAKKFRRKSTGSIQVAEDSTVNCSPASEKKNSANKKGAILENGMEEGEMEILIPNKKYKGKYKEAFQREIQKSLAKEDVKLNTLSDQSVGSTSNSTKPFASFEKVLKTPPAFVRKAVSKVTFNGKKSSQKVRNTDCEHLTVKGLFTLSESEKDQRERIRDQRKNFKHQRKFSLSLPLSFCLNGL